jgi:PAS domain S-box-containing protein
VSHLREVLETALDAVVVMREDGCVADWNGHAEAIFGWTREQALDQPMADLIIPLHLRDAHWRGLRAFLETGEAKILGRRIEVVAVRRDGGEVPVELAITPTEIHGQRHFLGFLRDITSRRYAEAVLARRAMEAELLFRVAALAGETDSFEDAIRSCLATVCRMTGWPVGHAFVVGEGGQELSPTMIWHHEDAGNYAPLRAATKDLRLSRGVGLPGRIMASGEPEWIADVEEDTGFVRAQAARELGVGAAFGFPVRCRGEVIAVLEFFSRERADPDPQMMTLVRTVGEQAGRVLERKKQDERQRLLLDELNHRVKNTLATVQSLAAGSRRGSSSPEEFDLAFSSRLAALSRAHDLLTRSSWEGASLEDVVRQTLAPYMAQVGVVTIAGPPVTLVANAAVTVHMGLHEMATNAAKYGALSVGTGRVSVEWWTQPGDPPRLVFDWRETGVPSVQAPVREGFGTRLIKAVGRELNARIEPQLRPDGLCFRWTAPASKKIAF